MYYYDNARRIFDGNASNGGSVPTPAPTPAPAPAPTPAPAPATKDGRYTVRSGDTLWKIAQRELGDGGRWKDIYAFNISTLRDPNSLVPGQVLTMPEPTTPTGSGAPGAWTVPFFD
jgi:nucleoid-associated protein YgaU